MILLIVVLFINWSWFILQLKGALFIFISLANFFPFISDVYWEREEKERDMHASDKKKKDCEIRKF